MSKFFIYIFAFLAIKGYSQSPIFNSLNSNQLGWGKFTLISGIQSDNIISKHININQKAKGMLLSELKMGDCE